MIHACAVRETLLALRCAISFKAKKEPPKIFSKKKKLQKEQYTQSPNKVKQKAKNI